MPKGVFASKQRDLPHL